MERLCAANARGVGKIAPEGRAIGGKRGVLARQGHGPPIDLCRNNVHLWYISLDWPAARVDRWRAFFSHEEWERAQRFSSDSDRRRFLMSHAGMRMILSQYLRAEPQQLRFSYTGYGKPFLGLQNDDASVQFSLSHSHQYALLAVARGRQVGVDIEYCSNFLIEKLLLAESEICSTDELQELRSLPANSRRQAFLNLWTRKEAVAKAIGYGLSLPFKALRVSFVSNQPAQLLCTLWDPNEVHRWRLRSIQTNDAYIAALAVEGHDWTLRRETFNMRDCASLAC